MKTRAVILAAGRGSRMGDATKNSHKCLTILSGQPLLSWQIKALSSASIDNISVVSGYKEEMLEGDFNKFHNPRWSETNMVASLFCVPASTDNTVISYSDIVYKSQHIEKLMKAEGDIVVLADRKWEDLWSLRFDNPLEDAETFRSEEGILKEIGGKTSDINNIEAQYMGLVKLTPIGWQKLFSLYEGYTAEKKDKMDMTSFLANAMANEIRVNVCFIDGGWCEVDNYNDVEVYEEQIRTNPSWSHYWI